MNLRDKFDYAGGGPVIREPDGSVLLMYHAERHRRQNPKDYYSTLGIARSNDNGSNFYDLGEVITPNATFASFKQRAEIGGGGFARFSSSTYAYFSDTLPDGKVQPFVVAAVARGSEQTNNWKKYFQGSFSEPGVGGRSSPLAPASIRPIWSSVAFCKYLNSLVMIYVQINKNNMRWELQLTWSADGLVWSLPLAVETEVNEALYPSLLGLSGDPSVLENEFYVYYTVSNIGAWNRWQDAALVRRKISLH